MQLRKDNQWMHIKTVEHIWVNGFFLQLTHSWRKVHLMIYSVLVELAETYTEEYIRIMSQLCGDSLTQEGANWH